MVCPKCGKGELLVYDEVVITRYRKVKNNGHILKRVFKKTETHEHMQEHLECQNQDCKTIFEFRLDNSGKVEKSSLAEC